ncbi:SGNH/GDSL hydrolase family protein [Rhodobacter ferrooxidans]|uniref:Lipolytic protein G-D-S-L family n=1 Tax=Rhodobacter ferrooxidans TaxID=371731 RepID=C8RW84_9RHOB|nr:SGNH/GDSL hydrolase family protein [Rhodobacter sp. SW2]EEW26827.1 lipolytic protein G-D-S-L family [Rhodobacter sp. SW2]
MRSLMCFGDSNTHGTMPMAELSDIGRYGRDLRWPGLLARALPGWQVIEEGHPGRTTLHDDPVEGPHRNGLRLLPALLESHRPLDLVILKLGTNDLKGRFSVNATDIALSLEKLIAVIRASGCGPEGAAPAVLLVAPPPILEVGCLAEIFEGGAIKSQALGAALARVAVRAGVPLVDAADHIAVSDLDGIHYDAGAHAALAEVLAQAVRQQFA